MDLTNPNGIVTEGELEVTKQKRLSKSAGKEEFNEALAKVATKEDFRRALAKLATKKDLKSLAELKADMKIVKWELSELRDEVRACEKKNDQRFDLVMQRLGGISGQILAIKTEMAATNHTFRQHEKGHSYERQISNQDLPDVRQSSN